MVYQYDGSVKFFLVTPPPIYHTSHMKRFAIFTIITLSMASAQSDMMELRKKVQNSKVQRTQNYLENVDAALSQGDIPAAERALSATIAQGVLTQAQINTARAAISSRSSGIANARAEQQRQMEAQRQAEIAAAEAEQQQVAANRRAAQQRSTNTGGSTTMPRQEEQAQDQDRGTELSRFQQQFRGAKTTFTLVSAGSGGLMSLSNHLLLKHSSGKTFSVQYDTGIGKGLSDGGKLSAGAQIEVKFTGSGEPSSAKNLANGNVVPLSNYKVTGYGW